MPFRDVSPRLRRPVLTGVATFTMLALLVPVIQGTDDATPTPAAAQAARDLQRDELRTLSARATVPPVDDRRAVVLDGLKGTDYVVAQAGVIEEAPEPTPTPEPTQTAEPEPEPTQTAEPEPEPTQTAEPEPEPTQTAEAEPTQEASSSSGGAYSSPDGQYTYEHSVETWERLAQCESGGDWTINTGNGYYGGIQFSKGSWDAVGGSGYPHENSKWEQIHRGELLHDQQGWGAWPACSEKLGLR